MRTVVVHYVAAFVNLCCCCCCVVIVSLLFVAPAHHVYASHPAFEVKYVCILLGGRGFIFSTVVL